MNPYLTKKAEPSSGVKAVEGILGIAAFLEAIFLGITLVYGVLEDGLVVGPVLILALLIGLLVALLCCITERKRARVHARVITSALCAAENGAMPFDELMKVTRINRLEQVINQLSGKGYIRQVAIIRGDVCLTYRENKQAVCAYCGAALTYGAGAIDKCPSCGSANIKY